MRFFKKEANNTIIPEWALFFDKKEYQLFIKEIDNYFKYMKINYKISDGVINVDENEFGFNILGLMNIAQLCKQAKLKYYRSLIAEHFNAMKRSHEFDKTFNVIINDFEKIKPYLGVRLYNSDYISSIGKDLVIGKELAGDIYAMIVFDLPDSVSNIQPEKTTIWNKSIDELYELGIRNIKAKYLLTPEQISLEELNIWIVQDDHFFVPNIIFDIENRKELIGRKGSLIGIPHRHIAIIYPIENIKTITAINKIIPMIYGMNQEGPGSLSNNLLWYHNKTLTLLPYEIEEKALHFFPPENFLEILNDLSLS